MSAAMTAAARAVADANGCRRVAPCNGPRVCKCDRDTRIAITAYHANLKDADVQRLAETMVSTEQWSSFWSLQDAKALVRAAIKALADGG